MIRPFWPALSRLVSAVLAQQKRAEVHVGVTDVSGDFTVVYSPSFPIGIVPHVNPQQIPQTEPNRQLRVTASSNTGFTVRAETRATLSVLGLNVIAAAPTATAGVAVSVLVREP